MVDNDDINLTALDTDELHEGTEVNVADETDSFVADRFSITSYGADYPVDALVKRMRSEAYFIPPFQRQFIWNQKQASRFIESLLLGLPVPGIFVFREEESSRHLVIDGQQRLRSLQSYYDGLFKDKKFKLVDVREPWNGKTYKELEEQDRRRLDDSIIHSTIFRQESPEDGNQSVYEVFERINSGGIKLSAQEIRSCVNFGPATDLLLKLNQNESWRAIFGKVSPRLKDQELILRFLAMFEDFENYKKPMSGFLNRYMEGIREIDEAHSRELLDLWEKTIQFCRQYIGDKIFRPERPMNAAVFDSVTVGVARRLRENEVLKPDNARNLYLGLLKESEFIDAYESGTSDEERVKKRMNMSVQTFSELE